MSISELANSLTESATLRINDRVARLRAEGRPVIHLGVGEPQNRAPASAAEAVEARLQEGMLKYTSTAGLPSLRAAIARHSSEAYRVDIQPRNVIVCNGSKHALFNLLAAIVDPGDEVIFPAPYWVSYPEMVKLVRGVGIAVPPIAGSLQPDPAGMLAAFTDRTRAVILNSPNNPSGLVYDETVIAELVNACESHGVYLIMDDIYRQLVFDAEPQPPAYSFTGRGLESTRVIVVNGVSKLYGLTGVRLGWAVGATRLIDTMSKIQGQTTSNASVLSQAAAEGALTGDQAPVQDLLQHLRRNRDVMVDELRAIDGLRLEPPAGALYCFPDFSAFETDSMRLSEFLLEKALVATVPGAEFGVDGHLRLGFAGRHRHVLEGVRRIRWALDPSQPAEITIGDQRMVRDWA